MSFKNEICAGIDCLLAIDWSLILKKNTEEIKFCRLKYNRLHVYLDNAKNSYVLLYHILFQQNICLIWKPYRGFFFFFKSMFAIFFTAHIRML